MRTAYAFPLPGAAGVEASALLVVNFWIVPSRNAKNTSTAYPTRNAIAKGGMETPCPMAKLLNRPTTAPPMAAIRNRGASATDGAYVRAWICCSKVRDRYAHVPSSRRRRRVRGGGQFAARLGGEPEPGPVPLGPQELDDVLHAPAQCDPVIGQRFPQPFRVGQPVHAIGESLPDVLEQLDEVFTRRTHDANPRLPPASWG